MALCHRKKGTFENLGGGPWPPAPPPVPTPPGSWKMLFRLDFCLNGLWFKIAFIFPSPRRQHFREKFFRCLFHSKSFEGPQLFDASYAPATTWKISLYICQVVASLPTKACYLSCILVVTKLVKKSNNFAFSHYRITRPHSRILPFSILKPLFYIFQKLIGIYRAIFGLIRNITKYDVFWTSSNFVRNCVLNGAGLVRKKRYFLL
jgi:hypothetical protein